MAIMRRIVAQGSRQEPLRGSSSHCHAHTPNRLHTHTPTYWPHTPPLPRPHAGYSARRGHKVAQ